MPRQRIVTRRGVGYRLPKRVQPTAVLALVDAIGRAVPAALARSFLALALCMVLGAVSGHGRPAVLPTAVLTFGLLGALSLGRGLKAERRQILDHAEYLYSLSLIHYCMSYLCIVALRLGGSIADS